jgi:hypothetical protein
MEDLVTCKEFTAATKMQKKVSLLTEQIAERQEGEDSESEDVTDSDESDDSGVDDEDGEVLQLQKTTTLRDGVFSVCKVYLDHGEDKAAEEQLQKAQSNRNLVRSNSESDIEGGGGDSSGGGGGSSRKLGRGGSGRQLSGRKLSGGGGGSSKRLLVRSGSKGGSARGGQGMMRLEKAQGYHSEVYTDEEGNLTDGTGARLEGVRDKNEGRPKLPEGAAGGEMNRKAASGTAHERAKILKQHSAKSLLQTAVTAKLAVLAWESENQRVAHESSLEAVQRRTNTEWGHAKGKRQTLATQRTLQTRRQESGLMTAAGRFSTEGILDEDGNYTSCDSDGTFGGDGNAKKMEKFRAAQLGSAGAESEGGGGGGGGDTTDGGDNTDGGTPGAQKKKKGGGSTRKKRVRTGAGHTMHPAMACLQKAGVPELAVVVEVNFDQTMGLPLGTQPGELVLAATHSEFRLLVRKRKVQPKEVAEARRALASGEVHGHHLPSDWDTVQVWPFGCDGFHAAATKREVQPTPGTTKEQAQAAAKATRVDAAAELLRADGMRPAQIRAALAEVEAGVDDDEDLDDELTVALVRPPSNKALREHREAVGAAADEAAKAASRPKGGARAAQRAQVRRCFPHPTPPQRTLTVQCAGASVGASVCFCSLLSSLCASPAAGPAGPIGPSASQPVTPLSPAAQRSHSLSFAVSPHVGQTRWRDTNEPNGYRCMLLHATAVVPSRTAPAPPPRRSLRGRPRRCPSSAAAARRSC